MILFKKKREAKDRPDNTKTTGYKQWLKKAYEKRYAIILILLVIFSFLLSYDEIKVVENDREYIAIDALEYLSLAENLDRGNGYKITVGATFESEKETSYRTPGYPFFIYAMRKIFGDQNYISAVILYQHFLLGFLPLLFYYLTLLIGNRRKYALFAAIITTLFFPFRYLANIVHPDFLGLFCLLVSICFLLSHLKRKNIFKLLLFSFFLMSAIMTKQNLISLCVLFIFPLPKFLKRKEYLVTLIFPFLFISTWVVRNVLVQREFPVFVSNGGFNFYIANNPELKTDLSNITQFNGTMKQLMKNGLSEVEADRELYRQGFANMKKNGFPWQVKRILKKIGVTFRDYYPPARNEIFFLLLPFVLVMPQKKYPLIFLILYQFIHSIISYQPHISLSGFFHANLMDITSLNFIGLASLFLLLWFIRPGQGIRMLAAVYLLILAPVFVFIPLDRLTIMTDFVLIIAYSLSPFVLGKLYRKKEEGEVDGDLKKKNFKSL